MEGTKIFHAKLLKRTGMKVCHSVYGSCPYLLSKSFVPIGAEEDLNTGEYYG
jgi:hypothetical protein